MKADPPFVTLIEKYTVSALSADLNVPYQTVAAWKQRKRIPVTKWPELIEAAKKRDIELSLELLHQWRACSVKSRKRAMQ